MASAHCLADEREHRERQIAAQRKLIGELKLKTDPRGAAHAKYLLAGLQLLQF
jgi:hypothetical protein